jgi:Serine dehydrogenase proteinase
MANEEPQFPRGKALPLQSPLFWVGEKDRYIRQLLISDIEEMTGRRLIVYYSDCESPAQIDPSDDKYLLELVGDLGSAPADLLLETNGGFTDATEKVVSILRDQISDLRAIIPKRAKSNGTLLALAAREIVLGPGSELGPIDPTIPLAPDQFVPAQFIVQAAASHPEQINLIVLQAAAYAIKQTQKLATDLLRAGMLKGKDEADIKRAVDELSTRDVYHSHGSVIDHREAVRLGLNVNYLSADDPLWKWLWLLRCMFEHDARRRGVIKIFEGRRISNAIRRV